MGAERMTALVRHPFRRAIEDSDRELLEESLHPDVTLVDPLMSFTWRGRDRVAAVLRAIDLVSDDLEYIDELAGDGTRALRFRLRVAGHRVRGLHHERRGKRRHIGRRARDACDDRSRHADT